MKLPKVHPKTFKQFKDWIEGPAFGDILDSGDKDIIELMNLQREYGTQVAFYLYCAILFVDEHGLAIACNEARYIYYEGAVMDVPEDRIDIRKPAIDFCVRMAENQAWDSETYYGVSKPPSSLAKRCKIKKFAWPVIPDITNNGEKISLANYLMHTVVSRFDHHKVSGVDILVIMMTCKCFIEQIVPWFKDICNK